MGNFVRAKVEFEDGTELKNFYQLTIHQHVEEHHTFTLECSLNAIESGTEPLINQSKSLFGKLIKVGFSDNSDNQSVQYFFKGIITQLSVDKFQGIGGNLVIKGYSPTILLEEGRKYATFKNKTISESVRLIMQDIPSNLLEASVDLENDSNVGYRIQYKESSFQYLQRLANSYAQWLYYDGTKLYFGKRKNDQQFDLKFGTDISRLQLDYKVVPSRFQLLNYITETDTILSGDSVNAQTPKLDDLSELLQTKSEQVFGKNKQISSAIHITQQGDMDNLVKRLKTHLGSQYLTLKGSCTDPNIKIGSVIKITGPNRADPSQNDDYGKYRIIDLLQTIEGGGGYKCQFEAISSEAPTPPTSIDPHYMPVEDEFATVKDNKDPNQMGRIQVQHIWQTGDETTDWLETTQAFAGSDRGFYFVPEIDDKVIVGFINGNPSLPYVKGSVYRKDHKPGNLYEDDNTRKAIALSANMFIMLDAKYKLKDKETEIISISSADSSGHPNYVLVTKDSEYGVAIHSANHKILISADTIQIESTSSMNIKADGDLNISSGGKLTLDAGQADVEIKGMNVKIEAAQKFSAEAKMEVKIDSAVKSTLSSSAQVEVKGGAMVEVTGAIIKLN